MLLLPHPQRQVLVSQPRLTVFITTLNLRLLDPQLDSKISNHALGRFLVEQDKWSRTQTVNSGGWFLKIPVFTKCWQS